MTVVHRLSKIFQPMTATSKTSSLTHKDVTSKSQRLMLELGIIHQANPGCFHFLPIGLKSLNKVLNIVDEEMQNVGGQKIVFPTLVKSELWKRSGRIKDMGPELMSLKDRHTHEYILAPTHEESVSHLISTLAPQSYKNFPLLLYQITSKFRDEMKPRFGLIRAREFIMKDLYSFDTSTDNAIKTYKTICESYDKVFQKIGLNYVKVQGSSGAMGGDLSHEYHYLADIGEDKIFICRNCKFSANVEILTEKNCPKCGEMQNIDIQTGIEVGHTFLLGEKYSKPLEAEYSDIHQKSQLLQMGSYGIGISRLLAAALECLSFEQELRWPDSIAPYNVVIIPPKRGSKEEKCTQHLPAKLYSTLESHIPTLKSNVLLDDRDSLTIGRRYIDAKRMGYRFVIVLNKRSMENPPLFECSDIYKDEQLFLKESEIVDFIQSSSSLNSVKDYSMI